LEVANVVRGAAKAVVVVGIGGSDLGGRVVREVLDPPYANELPESERGGAPLLYFTGNTFDPKELRGILSLLKANGLLKETVVIAISKSGATGETISAALIVAEALKEAGIEHWHQRFVAVTGSNERSVLYRMNQETPFLGILPIHDGVGGRFSVHTEVGLLPALVTASNPEARLADAVKGLTFADDLFFQEFDAESVWNLDPNRANAGNAAFQLAAQLHLHELWGRRNALIFYNYASDKSLGDWFTQLLSESIQERGGGLDVIPVTGPTGNHSILNGIARGPRNKVILFIDWNDLGEDLTIPRDTGIGGELAAFEGLKMSQVQAASRQGTQEDLTANGVPNMTLKVGKRDATHLFGLFRVLMDAIAVKGKLQNLDRFDDGSIDPSQELTYLQHGVEGYKNRTRAQALKMQQGG
jgi:glucose-6-phosphate isomerase